MQLAIFWTQNVKSEANLHERPNNCSEQNCFNDLANANDKNQNHETE